MIPGRWGIRGLRPGSRGGPAFPADLTAVGRPGARRQSVARAKSVRVRLEMGAGPQIVRMPIHTDLSAKPVEEHRYPLHMKLAGTCAAVASLPDAQCAHALMCSCIGPAKVLCALRTLPLCLLTDFVSVTMTQRGAWDNIPKQRLYMVLDNRLGVMLQTLRL